MCLKKDTTPTDRERRSSSLVDSKKVVLLLSSVVVLHHSFLGLLLLLLLLGARSLVTTDAGMYPQQMPRVAQSAVGTYTLGRCGTDSLCTSCRVRQAQTL